MNKIPNELKQIAAELGCNAINYITTTKEGEIFSLAEVDETGAYLPIGMPMLYAVNGSIVTPVDEDRVSEILSNIKS